ncbi:MAG: hypothetical protein KDC49_22810 [Saprospiraceae bacterium]|nr:hypothetical protein [Saprospiraceae bacterium]
MKLVLIHVILITLLNVTSQAQTILDSEFKWIKNEECSPKEKITEIFVKVEEDPMLTQFSKPEFDKLIGNVIKEINLATNINGTLKLKVLFAKGQNLCVVQFGTKSLELSGNQIDMITNRIHDIGDFKSGRQRNIEVDCLGILYITC